MPESAVDGVRGQVAVVTGASRGIGRAVAESLASAGASVALLARDAERLTEVAGVCRRAGAQVVQAPADVTELAAVREAVEMVLRRFGRVDLLVNAAGSVESVERPLWQADPDEWWRVFEVNVRGPALMLQSVVPGMVASGSGRIVNLASGMGTRPVPDYSAYATSKGALMRMTDSVAGPLRERGVRIFDVTPGLVHTDMTAAMPMWRDHPAEKYFDVDRVCRVVLDIAAGRLDALTGRFVHAGKDDVGELRAAADTIVDADARVLRLRPYGPGDPLS